MKLFLRLVLTSALLVSLSGCMLTGISLAERNAGSPTRSEVEHGEIFQYKRVFLDEDTLFVEVERDPKFESLTAWTSGDFRRIKTIHGPSFDVILKPLRSGPLPKSKISKAREIPIVENDLTNVREKISHTAYSLYDYYSDPSREIPCGLHFPEGSPRAIPYFICEQGQSRRIATLHQRYITESSSKRRKIAYRVFYYPLALAIDTVTFPIQAFYYVFIYPDENRPN